MMDNDITYIYPVKDILTLRGEKFVLDSFDSIADQSDDIIVVDYDSGDKKKLEEICNSHRFKFFVVERNDKWFDIAKISNKGIIEAKHGLFARLTPDVIYPEEFTNYIRTFYKYHDKFKEALVFRIHMDRKGEKEMGTTGIWNTELLLKARGIDERTSYYFGSHPYLRDISLHIFKLKFFESINYFNLIHRSHPLINKQLIKLHNSARGVKLIHWEHRITALKKDFDKEVKNVMNSYW